MSSELDRMLREARAALPDPDIAATQEARESALAAIRRRRRARIAVLTGVAIVIAIGLGVGLGTLVAPSGTAAREPAGVGFLPEPGWYALQSPPPAVEGQPVVAVAANVPLAPDDVVNGLVDPSGLPYSTLTTLPVRGVVIVATLTPETPPNNAPVPVNPYYPKGELPLRLPDAVPYVQWGAQVRPDEPLAQYQLRAQIRDYNVELTFYFGTATPSPALRAATQRQLEGLVISSKPTTTTSPHSRSGDAAPMPATIDRTYSCATQLTGGIYQVESRAHAGHRVGGEWSKLAYALVASGNVTITGTVPSNALVWVTAGTPSASTRVDNGWESFAVRVGGTLGVNRALCELSRAVVPLSSRDLRGGRIDALGRAIDCDAPKRIFLRLRAVTLGKASLRERARAFIASDARVREAKIAVRTPSGKPLAYAEVFESGKARLFTAKGCTEE